MRLPAKPSKYRSKRITLDGINFHSYREARRYSELKLLQKAGHIEGLELQRKFPFEVNGQHICSYICDFSYIIDGKLIIEDSKGVVTREFSIKRKLLRAIYGLEILLT